MRMRLIVRTGAAVIVSHSSQGFFNMLAAAGPSELSTISTHHFAAHT